MESEYFPAVVVLAFLAGVFVGWAAARTQPSDWYN